MKKIVISCLFLLIPFTVFAADEIRYKLYEVEKINNSFVGNGPFKNPSATGENKNLLLVDTETGKTWILTLVGMPTKDSEGNEIYISQFAWEPIVFKTNVRPIWDKGLSFLPR